MTLNNDYDTMKALAGDGSFVGDPRKPEPYRDPITGVLLSDRDVELHQEMLLARILSRLFGEAPWDDSALDTARRVLKYWKEMNGSGRDGVVEEMVPGEVELPFEFRTFKAEKGQMIVVPCIEFSSLCVGPRTRIASPSGYRPVFKVRPGNIIYGSVGGKLVETEVTAISTSCKPTRVTVEGAGFSLQLSHDHPVMTQRGWVEAGDLTTDDFVPFYNTREFCRGRVEVATGYSLGYVLGAIASDGYIEIAKHKRRVKLAVREQWFAEKFSTHVREALGLSTIVKSYMKAGGFNREPRPTFEVQFFDVDAIDKLVRLFGGLKRWNNQQVPEICKKLPDVMQGYMDGYHDGDGTTYTNYGGFTTDKILSNNADLINEMYSLGVVGKPYHNLNGQTVATKLKLEARGGKATGLRRNYTPDPSIEIDLDSWPCEMRRIQGITSSVSNHKPYTYYDLQCEPYPVFIGNGVPMHNCAHHLLPFMGKAHIAYVSNKLQVGLSKIPRLVDFWARRPQVQERLTAQLGHDLKARLDPHGVMVVIEATHTCMSCRGVRKHNGAMVTSLPVGVFMSNPKARDEFFALVSMCNNK